MRILMISLNGESLIQLESGCVDLQANIVCTQTLNDAAGILTSQTFDLIVMQLALSDTAALGLLELASIRNKDVQVIAMIEDANALNPYEIIPNLRVAVPSTTQLADLVHIIAHVCRQYPRCSRPSTQSLA